MEVMGVGPGQGYLDFVPINFWKFDVIDLGAFCPLSRAWYSSSRWLECIWGYPKIGYEQAPWRQVGLPTPSCLASPVTRRGSWGLEAPQARRLANVKAAFCRAAATGRPFAARRPLSRRFALPLMDRRRLPPADRWNCRWKPAVGPLNFASWGVALPRHLWLLSCRYQ